jgi:hypothetical protein
MGFFLAVYTNKFYQITLDNKKPASFIWSGFAGHYRTLLNVNLAEEQGFEPWVGLPPQRFSRPSRSTAPALLRWYRPRKNTWILLQRQVPALLFAASKPHALNRTGSPLLSFFCIRFSRFFDLVPFDR